MAERLKVVEGDSDESRTDSSQTLLASVSTEMVRLYKQQFGRGPTKVRTHWGGPDALIVFLEDTLTPAERNMVKMGEHQRLRDVRMFFQYATVAEFCEPVERQPGAKSAPSSAESTLKWTASQWRRSSCIPRATTAPHGSSTRDPDRRRR